MTEWLAPPPRRCGRRQSRARRAGCLALVALHGCAGFSQERHLAPIFSELSIAGGDRQLELLGGAFLVRRELETRDVRYWALRPIVSREWFSPTETFTWFLPPLGRGWTTPVSAVFMLVPLFRYSELTHDDGPPTWSFLALPGIYWAKTNDGRIVRAWFPFGGVVEDFLSFDRAWFVLWPLFTHIERYGRTTRHFLWPFFTFSSGAGGIGWRVWPLIGVNRWEGRYVRWFFLWPFFHWQRNQLMAAEGKRETNWMVWPLFGYRRAGASRSYTVLWPFFGYSGNPELGFWAWDGPWPFVVLQEPGTTGQASRVRFWPIYSWYRGDQLTSWSVLWPFFNRRSEVYANAKKDTTYVFPLWHAWDRVDDVTGESHWRKLFPLFRTYRAEQGDELFYAFPALNPLWRLRFIDEHYAWMWELYSSHRVDDHLRQRSWLGLWRREKDRDEDRRSLAGVWARREYSMAGEPVRETSLLLGLLRWRSGPDGWSLLAPAFPGPGWPLQRVPTSLAPDARAATESRP